MRRVPRTAYRVPDRLGLQLEAQIPKRALESHSLSCLSIYPTDSPALPQHIAPHQRVIPHEHSDIPTFRRHRHPHTAAGIPNPRDRYQLIPPIRACMHTYIHTYPARRGRPIATNHQATKQNNENPRSLNIHETLLRHFSPASIPTRRPLIPEQPHSSPYLHTQTPEMSFYPEKAFTDANDAYTKVFTKEEGQLPLPPGKRYAIGPSPPLPSLSPPLTLS